MSEAHKEWLRVGPTVYQLQHYGWKKGVEQMQNTWSVSVQSVILSSQEKEEVARLIAAAPDLLSELENCVDVLSMFFPSAPLDSCIGAAIIKARAAIAKAQPAAEGV